MSIFELWLLTTFIPELSGTLNVFAWISALCVIITFVMVLVAEFDEDMKTPAKKYGRIAVICLATFGTLTCFVPNERQMLLIAGGYTATNNAEIKKLPSNAAKAVNAWLDAVTEAAKPETK